KVEGHERVVPAAAMDLHAARPYAGDVELVVRRTAEDRQPVIRSAREVDSETPLDQLLPLGAAHGPELKRMQDAVSVLIPARGVPQDRAVDRDDGAVEINRRA